MASKKVSVIVLNYNGKQYLKEYFDSVFAQTLIPQEIILLDNASTDDSCDFVKRYFPKVKIIKNTYNAGTAEGSNIAFRHSTGDYVVFQSNDIRLDKNCIKILVETLERGKTTGIVTSVLLRSQIDKKTGEHLIDNAGGIADIYGFGMQNYPNRSIKEIPEQEEVFFSYGGSFIIRREVFEETGGFDSRFFTLNDDVDLSWRARLRGYTVVYNKKSIVYHKISATLGQLFGRPLKRYWSERNIIRTILKNYDLTSLLTRFPVYVLLLLGEMGYFLLRGRFSLFFADLKAILWNVINILGTYSLRKKVQQTKINNDLSRMLIQESLKLKLFSDFHRAI